MNISSDPALSSKRSSLNPDPPLDELVLTVLLVCSSGRVYGTVCCALKTQPVTSGRSGLPSRKLTTTSCPMRGTKMEPHALPAQPWATRIQQELVSSLALLWSQ